MRILTIILILLIAFTAPLWALNMERFGSHAPEFFVHSLDVELHGDLALVTGYGGLMIYDVSEGVEYLNRYLPGGDGGRGNPVYNCSAHEDLAFVTARGAGLYIVDISDPAQPALIRQLRMPGESFEDSEFRNDELIISAHRAGLYFVDMTDPGEPELTGTYDEMTNCWELDLVGDLLYVADGEGGLVIIRLADEIEVLSRTETSGTAIDVKVSGDQCAIATGATGVDLFDISDPTEPILLSTMDTPTYAGHIGFDGDLIAVADWDEALVYDVSNPEEPVLDGRHYTGYRAMGVDVRENRVYLADWSKFIGYTYGEIDGADIAFSTQRIVPDDNEVIDTSLYVYNHGQQQLAVSRVYCQAVDFEVDPEAFELDSGDSIEVSFSFQPNSNTSYPLRFRSNDSDDPTTEVKLEASGGLSVGDEAPDFTANILGGGQYRLSDNRDRIQVLIFWASW